MQIVKKFIDNSTLTQLYDKLTAIAEQCRYEPTTKELDELSDIYDDIRTKFHEIEELHRQIISINMRENNK